MRRVIKPGRPNHYPHNGYYPDPWGNEPLVKPWKKILLGLLTAFITCIYLAIAGGLIWLIVEVIKWIQRH